MKSRRILLVMMEPPLPKGCAPARWYYVLYKGLVDRGYDVTAFATCTKASDIELANSLFPSPEYDLRCYLAPEKANLFGKLETLRQPYSRLFSAELRQDLNNELAKPFDILHLEQLWSGWLGLKHVDKALVNVHHLVGIDLEYARPNSPKQLIEHYLMFQSEQRLMQAYRHFRSCSPRLEPEIRKNNPQAQITNVPVGIDSSQYSYIPDESRNSNYTIGLIANMNWYPGFSAAKRLLDRLWLPIKQQIPQARLQIVGWNACSALSEYLDLPDVEIAENVPETQPYFESTNVFLYAPARGSGMKIKILEALAMGIPIVTTSEGIEGLAAEDGVHVGISEDDEGLIERTIKLLKDPIAQNRQRRAGRQLLEEQCSPQVTLDAIEQIYLDMMSVVGSQV
jgi:polysaccharide biosynthesis protein PslH